ncbi:hypothetical protein KL950_003543 [Ogataea haglerorum]|nr:hypothetical protein KL950_003543 [Ogataea haglerorum]KAG7709085.1 hypothetical protein KL914_001475 [Ogataea haglerorum]KAG7741663.1 hypothetical protein KL923_000918 [Ogataea haglerorum]
MVYLNGQSIKCETKRKFYEAATENTIPGLPLEPLKPETSKVGQNRDSKVEFLEENIKRARLQLIQYLGLAKDKYIQQSEQYYKVERQVTDTLSSLHDKREELFPNSLYVLTGFLTGVVFTRRSNILVRSTVPLLCGVAAFRFFLPSTFSNVICWFDNYERKHQPELWSSQKDLFNKASKMIDQADKLATETVSVMGKYLDETKRMVGTYAGLNVEQKVTEKKNK